jgi:hypothetical protein
MQTQLIEIDDRKIEKNDQQNFLDGFIIIWLLNYLTSNQFDYIDYYYLISNQFD